MYSWTVENHPAYQDILELAKDHRDEIIALMLEDMEPKTNQTMVIGIGPGRQMAKRCFYPWFEALNGITGEWPVPYTHRGRVQIMADCWVQWGKDNGYI